MRIIKPLAALCVLALIALHIWVMFPGYNLQRASGALRITSVATFAVFMAEVIRCKRSDENLDPPQWAVNAAGLFFLYGVCWFAVLFIAFRGGSVYEDHGRYFQDKWLGHSRETSWEVREPQYRRYTTMHMLAFSAFLVPFALLPLTTPREAEEDAEL